MIDSDLERWKIYLNPGCSRSHPPTDHTTKELALELIDDILDSEKQERIEELEDEVRTLRDEIADLQDEIGNLRDRE